MKKKVVLILGSLSDIAKSIAHEFGKNGYNLLLAARKNDELIIQSEDLRIRYNIEVNFYNFDILKKETYKDFIKNLKEMPSIIICAVGFMGEQNENEKDLVLIEKILKTNFVGPINIISEFANISIALPPAAPPIYSFPPAPSR